MGRCENSTKQMNWKVKIETSIKFDFNFFFQFSIIFYFFHNWFISQIKEWIWTLRNWHEPYEIVKQRKCRTKFWKLVSKQWKMKEKLAEIPWILKSISFRHLPFSKNCNKKNFFDFWFFFFESCSFYHKKPIFKNFFVGKWIKRKMIILKNSSKIQKYSETEKFKEKQFKKFFGMFKIQKIHYFYEIPFFPPKPSKFSALFTFFCFSKMIILHCQWVDESLKLQRERMRERWRKDSFWCTWKLKEKENKAKGWERGDTVCVFFTHFSKVLGKREGVVGAIGKKGNAKKKNWGHGWISIEY